MRRQCELLGLSRSSLYYDPIPESEENLRLMRRIDELYLDRPYYGSRRMTAVLQREGHQINRKRVQRLMRSMGIEAVYPKPCTTQRNEQHRVFPYLLRNVPIVRCNQVFSTDITYIPMSRGFLYLVAVIDWHSRYVLSWRLSNSLDGGFCLEALEEALSIATPEIFNTDQGVQFTSDAFTSRVLASGALMSMDGKGRAIDNVFVERLWRSVKYEEVYLKEYTDGWHAEESLGEYFEFYRHQRPHQSLEYKTPAEVYFQDGGART